ncbi:hypothetical protein MRX96_015392 [Rhipicephalus microplus]
MVPSNAAQRGHTSSGRPVFIGRVNYIYHGTVCGRIQLSLKSLFLSLTLAVSTDSWTTKSSSVERLQNDEEHAHMAPTTHFRVFEFTDEQLHRLNTLSRFAHKERVSQLPTA